MTNASDSAALSAAVTALQAASTAAEADLAQAASTITALEAQVVSLNTQVDTLTTELATANNELTAANSTIAALQAQLAQETVPFAASFARPIPSTQPLDPNSAAIVKVVENYVAKPEGTEPSGGYFWGINLGANGVQVMEASTTLVPLVCVGRPGYPSSLPAGFPAKIGIPAAAAVGRALTGSANVFSKDLPFVLLDPVNGIATEIWELTVDDAAGSGYHCTNAGQYAYTPPATGVGKGGKLPFGETALSAAGLSYAATLLMQSDVEAGVAKHMLACALPVGAQPPRMPATASDYANAPAGVNPAAYPGQGTIYRLPASTVVPATWPLTERVIATALRDYGMICIDQAGAPQIQAQGPIGGLTSTNDPISAGMAGAQEYNVLSNIPWSTLEVVLGPTDWTATVANWS